MLQKLKAATRANRRRSHSPSDTTPPSGDQEGTTKCTHTPMKIKTKEALERRKDCFGLSAADYNSPKRRRSGSSCSSDGEPGPLDDLIDKKAQAAAAVSGSRFYYKASLVRGKPCARLNETQLESYEREHEAVIAQPNFGSARKLAMER